MSFNSATRYSVLLFGVSVLFLGAQVQASDAPLVTPDPLISRGIDCPYPHSANFVTLRIKGHILRPSSCDSTAEDWTMAEAVADIQYLISFLTPLGVSFFSEGIEYICDDHYWGDILGNHDVLYSGYNAPDRLDVFFSRIPYGHHAQAISIPGNACWIAHGLKGGPGLTHEIGHCLGLRHLNDTRDSAGNACDPFTQPCCDCGDLICTTPPTLTMPGNCGVMEPGCMWQGQQWMNLMGTGCDTCAAELEEEQVNRMLAMIEYSEVLQPTVLSPAVFENRSVDTGLDYAGQPYASAPIDYDNDGWLDLIIAVQNYDSQVYQMTGVTEDGVPTFAPRTSDIFDEGVEPQAGLRHLAVADYNNDGFADFFAADSLQSRLYTNRGPVTTVFEDRASLLPQSSLVDAWAGSWGDYDNDGKLDLLVVGGQDVNHSGDLDPNDGTGLIVLLENHVLAAGGFVDVSESVGFGWPNTALAASAAWGDADGDGDLDLFIADTRDLSGGGSGSFQFWLNDGAGHFALSNTGRFPDGYKVQANTAVRWADMDSDGDLDLVISQESAWQTPWVYYNDGLGVFDERPPAALAAGIATAGVRVYDQDLDGVPDIMLLPRDSNESPLLFRNRVIGGEYGFSNETLNVVLSDTGQVRGAVVADFNHDGDMDVYLGRTSGGEAFYYRNVQRTGVDVGTNHWVGLRLEASRPEHTDVGAMVTLSAGGWTQVQIVDGGCGRGGQMDRALVWGLGGAAGPVTATIRWPDGCSQEASLTIDAMNVVSQVVDILAGSVSVTSEINPEDATIDWVFRWQTNVAAEDTITIQEHAAPCELPATILTFGSTGVEYTQDLSGDVWQHELRWLHRTCFSPCQYNYTIASSDADACANDSVSGVFKVKVCPAQ